MQTSNLAGTLHSIGRVLAWLFVAVGIALTAAGTWTWLRNHNDDIAAICAFFSFSAGIYLTVSLLPYALKRHWQQG